MEKLKCRICEKEFPLLAERRYTARGLRGVCQFLDEPLLFDAYDCPHCGCQNIVQPRKRAVMKVMVTELSTPNRNENIMSHFFNPFSDMGLFQHTLSAECMNRESVEGMQKAGLYFENAVIAQNAIAALKAIVKETGFLSLADLDHFFGGVREIPSNWGWTDLSRARVVRNNRGYYISFPALTNRPTVTEATE